MPANSIKLRPGQTGICEPAEASGQNHQHHWDTDIVDKVGDHRPGEKKLCPCPTVHYPTPLSTHLVHVWVDGRMQKTKRTHSTTLLSHTVTHAHSGAHTLKHYEYTHTRHRKHWNPQSTSTRTRSASTQMPKRCNTRNIALTNPKFRSAKNKAKVQVLAICSAQKQCFRPKSGPACKRHFYMQLFLILPFM